MTAYPIEDVEGIGPVYAARLFEQDIRSTEDYLAHTHDPAARHHLADQSKISEELILRWANMADLMRVKGVGGEYAELLRAAGVDTVPELAERNPDHLVEALRRTNAEKSLVRHVPSASMVVEWIAEAKSLGSALAY